MKAHDHTRSSVVEKMMELNEIDLWSRYSDMFNRDSIEMFTSQFGAEPHALDFAQQLFRTLKRSNNRWILSAETWVRDEIVNSDNKTAVISINVGGRYHFGNFPVLTVPLSYRDALAVVKHANREDAPSRLLATDKASEFFEELLGRPVFIDRKRTSDSILRNSRRRQVFEIIDISIQLANTSTDLHIGDAVLS